MNEVFPFRDETMMRRMEKVDAACLGLARKVGAEPCAFPALIDRGILEKAGYPATFPHLLMSACTCQDPGRPGASLLESRNMTAPRWCLSPTVCHHIYPHLAEQPISGLRVITACGSCFRNEETEKPGERQIEFRMREIVLAGPEEDVESALGVLRCGVDAMARDFALEVEWKQATDPFFMPSARLHAMAQQVTAAKWEMTVPARKGLAIASINRHRDHFARAFDLKLDSGAPAVTACVAFGLDRWVALFGERA